MDARCRRLGLDPAGRALPGDADPGPDPGQPTVFEVRVKGHLDDWWAGWRDGLSVTREAGGETVLTVPALDQAALHGLLRKLRDVGVPLVSINPAGSGQTGDSIHEEENR
jgi:hypothetical protein